MKKYGKSKTRDMEVSAVTGATPRAYETHPTPNSKGSQTLRGRGTVKGFKGKK